MTATQAAQLTSPTAVSHVGRSRAIGRLGTTARAAVGVVLLAFGVGAGGHWITWWQLALGIVAMPAAVAAAQLTRLAFTNDTLRLTNHLASCINCALLFVLLGFSPTRTATLVFLGASLLLAAVRGYGGCESLAIPNWLLHRNDQVGCYVFLPVDNIEARRERGSA
jgi:hypothetical protein